MCWSAPVSLAFTLLDAAMAAFLIWRRRGADAIYGTVLICVMAQELFQFLLWWDGTLWDASETNPGACSTRAKVFSFGTMYSAFSVTLAVLGMSYYRPNIVYWTYNTLQKWRLAALGCWILGVGFGTFAVVYTGTWCVRVGPHHHQQWICALSLSKLDGGGIHNFPWLTWLYLLWYSFSVLLAGITIQIPKVEFIYFSLFQGIMAAIIYIRFLYTSEACSVWCWSGFIFGICAIMRPNLETTTIWKKAKEFTNEDVDDVIASSGSSSEEAAGKDTSGVDKVELSPLAIEEAEAEEEESHSKEKGEISELEIQAAA